MYIFLEHLVVIYLTAYTPGWMKSLLKLANLFEENKLNFYCVLITVCKSPNWQLTAGGVTSIKSKAALMSMFYVNFVWTVSISCWRHFVRHTTGSSILTCQWFKYPEVFRSCFEKEVNPATLYVEISHRPVDILLRQKWHYLITTARERNRSQGRIGQRTRRCHDNRASRVHSILRLGNC